jgi:hypothetical protein
MGGLLGIAIYLVALLVFVRTGWLDPLWDPMLVLIPAPISAAIHCWIGMYLGGRIDRVRASRRNDPPFNRMPADRRGFSDR